VAVPCLVLPFCQHICHFMAITIHPIHIPYPIQAHFSSICSRYSIINIIILVVVVVIISIVVVIIIIIIVVVIIIIIIIID
jgi:hypothetical protein